MKFKTKEAEGITLIALVITIIVLLILAGVTIATLTGDNGILTKTSGAKILADEADEKEALLIAYSGALSEVTGENITEDMISNQLIKKMGRKDIIKIEGNDPIIVSFKSKRRYILDRYGKVEILDDIANYLKVGDYVNYLDKNDNKILCKVLYNNEEYGVQLVSLNPVDTITLGTKDSNIPEECNTNYKKSKWSYNNAIKTLNDKVENYRNPKYTAEGKARCIGSVPNNPLSESEYINGNYEYLTKCNLNGQFKDTDNNYETDYMQLEKIASKGIKDTTKANSYWMSSRNVDIRPEGCNFMIRIVNNAGIMNSGSLNLSRLMLVYSNGEYFGESWSIGTSGVRPVFQLKPNVKIDNSEGKDGTSEENAYDLII